MSLLSTAVVADTLVATPKLLHTLVGNLPVTLHTWHPTPDDWSINEVVGHLIAADQVAFAGRIQHMITQDHPTIPAIDVNQIARERQDDQRDLMELLDEFTENRQNHARLVRSLTEEKLARTGFYVKYGDFRVADFVYEWAYHDHAHVQQIMEILKRAVWPHFSATMQQALGG